MKVTDCFNEKMTLSFEVFPLGQEQAINEMRSLLDVLYGYAPDFINCTYGAGGSAPGRSKETSQIIAKDNKTIPVTHYTCINHSKSVMKNDLDDFKNMGINHVLALRGDFPKNQVSTGGTFNYASELVAFIKKECSDLCIAVSGNPEIHINCKDEDLDLARLKIKQDLGADYIMAQACHDVDIFKSWLERIRTAGITIPVVAGILPVFSKNTTVFASYLNGISIPSELSKIIGLYGSDPEDFKKAGMDYSKKQISRFMNAGMNGLHLYTMNKSTEIDEILTEVGFLKNL